MAALILPPAPWRARAGLTELAGALGAGNARFVGGAVRDTLLGIDVQDVDIATPLRPEDVADRARAAGFKAVPTGIAHGTITVVLPSGPVEVTTLRRDVCTDGRHAVVEFADDWREDAARRDFTMNALYADPDSGEVFDYFGGVADLRAGHVRFIGAALQRIAEDHLRILRFFRFLSRFGDVPDPEGLAACVARANDLMALSRERIRDELLKLLVARGAVSTMALMIEHAILRAVVPEIGADGVERLRLLADREAAAGIAPDPIRRLAALLPADTAEAVGARLKLSNLQRKRLAGATAGTGTEGPRGLAYRLDVEQAIDRLLLAGEDVAPLRDFVPPRAPLGGGAIIARGVRAGPEVARLLKEVETRWIAAGFPDDAEAIADAVVDQALRDTSKS
jgi:poly(A) polymerase